MATLNFLYKKEYQIDDYIKVIIPTVGQILDNEDVYYGMVTAFTAMPIDLMVQLDDLGIDFSEITDYDLFLLLFNGIKTVDSSLLFGDLSLESFEIKVNQDTGDMFIQDAETGLIIDKNMYYQISAVLRKMHHIEKNKRKPANDDAKNYMLQRAREKQRRNRNRKTDSQIESLIIAMVNAPEYKYNYESTLDLTIYQFNESVRQIIKRVDYNNRMFGIYSGTINAKEISQDDLNWLIHK